jgi:hypothetical protein
MEQQMKKIQEEKIKNQKPKRVIKLKDNYGLKLTNNFVIEEIEDMIETILEKYE